MRWAAGLFEALRAKARKKFPGAAVRIAPPGRNAGHWLTLEEAELFLASLDAAVKAARAEAVREREAKRPKGA